MIKHLKLIVIALSLVILSVPNVQAMNRSKPKQDKVIFDLTAEDWVMTQTARVVVGVNAAVTQKTAGGMRKQMLKSVNSVAKASWRLTNFYRNQDSTGMEKWSASFEARLPEAVLSGLSEQAQKESKAGLQIKVKNIDFTPTLTEREAVKSTLRTQIYKQAQKQLAELNEAITGRNYRISMINFSTNHPAARSNYRAKNMALMEASGGSMNRSSTPSMERSEKMTLNAYIELAAEQKQTAESK